MGRTRFTKPTQIFAGLLTGLLFAMLAVPAGAQPATESRTGQGLGPVYDAAHETTLNGTIQQIVTKHVAGSPAGMHLMVAGPQGLVDAHVGPYLSKTTQAALRKGVPVQIVGATEQAHGKEYFLARQLTFSGGRTVTIRTANGFLVQSQAGRAGQSKNTTSASKGGTR